MDFGLIFGIGMLLLFFFGIAQMAYRKHKTGSIDTVKCYSSGEYGIVEYPCTTKLNAAVDYAWGEGKDLSSLLPDVPLAYSSPDFPELLARTTMAQIEEQWMRDNPSEVDHLKEQIEIKNKLVDAKSNLIAKTNQENADLRRQVANYRAMAQPDPMTLQPGGVVKTLSGRTMELNAYTGSKAAFSDTYQAYRKYMDNVMDRDSLTRLYGDDLWD